MRDLEIWQRLVTSTATAADLRALATLPLERRAPYLGHVVALAAHADPELRTAALTALAGVRGVPGVRALVAALDADEREVRDIAVAALRTTARDAPDRYAHALFHRRAEVRRAALAHPSSQAIDAIAAHLRADPECRELAAQLPWPSSSLALGLDLYRAGNLGAAELVDVLVRAPITELRSCIETDARRGAEAIDAFLDEVTRADRPLPAPGHDVLDPIVAAIAGVEHAGSIDLHTALVPPPGASRAIAALVEAIAPRQRKLARRAAAALISLLARHRVDPALHAACAALEPRAIGFARLDPVAAAHGLVRYRWPIKPSVAQIDRLITRARDDLALAAALAGLYPDRRLARLAERLGEGAIVEALITSDHGFDVICALAPETPALELTWLVAVLRGDWRRYVELAARGIVELSGKRLEAFVDQIPRIHRSAAYAAALGHPLDAERLAAICKVLAGRVERGTLASLLAGVAPAAIVALVRAVPEKAVAAAVATLDDDAAVRLIAALDGPDAPPRDRELAIARTLAGRADPAIAAWLAKVSTAVALRPLATRAVATRRLLDHAERERIATCAPGELHKALAPAFAAPVVGLVDALALRAPMPSVSACAALLGCADPFDAVARQLDRFVATSDDFARDLDTAAMTWLRADAISPLAHARLYRWEAHTVALAKWIESTGGVLAALEHVEIGTTWLARETLWRGISEAVMFFRYRDATRFAREATAALAEYCAERIDRDIGQHAARVVVALVESKVVPVAAVRDRVLDRVADASLATRELAARLIRLDGMPDPPSTPRTQTDREALAELRALTDLDALLAWCADPRPLLVQEAALALVIAGEPGQLRLASLLPRLDELAAPVAVLATIALWDSPTALDAARALAAARQLPPASQFHLCLGLAAHGDRDHLPRALDAVRVPGWFFRRDDWEALVRVADPAACAIALADAPHHHAYQKAIAILLALDHTPHPLRGCCAPGVRRACDDPDVAGALRRFLAVDGDRPLLLRRAAARRLAGKFGDLFGLPLLVEQIIDAPDEERPGVVAAIPNRALPAVADALANAALVGGHAACPETRFLQVLDAIRTWLPADQLAALYVRTLEEATTSVARNAAGIHAIGTALAHSRMTRVAEVFAWGVRRGLELTGRMYRIHLTAKERDLGHTYLESTRVFVSALPMLRDEAHGEDIVEGLVLHELGHHVYHRAPTSIALWKQAHAEGLGHLLNLIADEHLERNLRAIDPAYGDRLKRLDAYAFHHAPQEIGLAALLASLRGAAATALIAADLEVAFAETAVRLRRGAVLATLDRAGHPLARFARALRMGLGNRSGDPRVAEALALCRDLKGLDMAALYAITRRIADLFGGAVCVAQVFGGPEGLVFGERDDDVFGRVDDGILQREVERILDPRGNKRGSSGPRDRLCINVNPDERFARIARVERVRADRGAHQAVAGEVARHASRLRALLDDLGLRWEASRGRVSGRAVDRPRLRHLVTRGDPRILIARQPVRRTDLFLGTLIDCSGSMAVGGNIDRARRFAVMVAEAVQPLAGVDARFFGFTDTVIYDAGNAADCSVVSLQTSGGNNDAAALFHVANLAAASPKRARVLVMISDGLPTECSVAALRGLVRELTRRRGMVCAQVAVRPLDEVCFPHYVVLDDREPEVAVARFGRMIGDLARRVLAS